MATARSTIGQVADDDGAGRAMPWSGRLTTHWRGTLLVAALVLGIVGRVAYSARAPLWIDETFTGVIASQPDFAALVGWCLHELTGPAFYMPLWLWAQLAGNSDFALRAPSLAMAVLAPLLILWRGHRDRDLRLFWAVTCLLWVPAFAFAGEARPYPMLFLLGVGQTVALLAMLRRPTLARSALWVALSGTMVLTNYWAAVPAIVQGCAFLHHHRARALRAWPAALLLVPVLLWGRWHLPMVLDATVGGVSGRNAPAGLDWTAIFELPAMLFGISLGGTVILGAIALSFGRAIGRNGLDWPLPMPERTLILAALSSFAVILVLAFLRPGFTPRYATPAMPALLFALACWLRWVIRIDPRLAAIALGMMLASATGLTAATLAGPDRDARHFFNIERPSAWLANKHPRRLLIFWDGPIAAGLDPARLAEIGGFFFRRSGTPIKVDAPRIDPGGDPNPRLLAAARRDGDDAILWLSNEALPASRRPRIAALDHGFECRDFGGGHAVVTACRRRR